MARLAGRSGRGVGLGLGVTNFPYSNPNGLPGYRALERHVHRPKTVGAMAGHVVLPWIHRAFANLKRWLMGTLHGVRKSHLQRYLDEFAFRWNRRRSTAAAFDTLLGLAARMDHASERDFVLKRA